MPVAYRLGVIVNQAQKLQLEVCMQPLSTGLGHILENICQTKLKLQKQPPEMVYKKGVLKNSGNSQENTCSRVSFLIKLKKILNVTLYEMS